MREYLARLLQEHWTVEIVGDGADALTSVRRDPPDLVLSDVMMPGLDGFGLVRELRSDRELRTIPIVLLSARAGEEATGEALQAGANDYVVKPFSARELIARIRSQLTIAAVRREAEADKEAQRRVVASLFNHAPAGIAMIRGKLQIIDFANPMALEIWGKTSEVVGLPLLEALPELKGQGFDELIQRVMESGVPFVGEELRATFKRQGQEEHVYLKFVYAPAQNERGVVDGVAAFGFDVTTHVVNRKRAQLAATIGRVFVSDADLGDQLRSCCEAFMDAGVARAWLWTCNPDQHTLELRAHAGVSPEQVCSYQRLPLHSGWVGRVARTRTPELLSCHDDPELSVLCSSCDQATFAAAPLFVGDRLLGMLAVIAPRGFETVNRETLSTLADQIALGVERDNAERFRELFIGVLGHDLRNPLNAVNMATHVLTAGQLSPPQLRTVQRIRTSAGRMKRMVDQVLDFTRARSGGGIPVVREPGDIRRASVLRLSRSSPLHGLNG